MRWSQMFTPTLREDSADADAPSHRLLLRGGFIRQLMAGHYSLLPLAVRVRSKVMDIIREELDGIGAQEFLLPAMHPAEIWRKSGRWDSMGQEMFRLRDRKGADLALGMTHEEIITTLALELNSYKQLPQMWYQFQSKFRDEARPKSGLMRVREFTMKDSYSFDLDSDGLDRSFGLHRDAYVRIFRRLGIPAIAVQASSGSMGGSASTEFMCPSEVGEDFVVHCAQCDYAANIEKATSRLAVVQDETGPLSPERFDTPNARTIEELAEQHQASADRQVKTLVFMADGEITLALVRGDHKLSEQKLTDMLGARQVRPASADEILEKLGASPGSLGAVGVSNIPVIADEALRGRRNMFTGANTDGVHLRGVDVERDIHEVRWADLREVAAGDACPQCGEPLQVQKAIEVGHIFKLGYRYTDVLGASVLNADGKRVPMIMGCYGIGVERALAAVVECHHDDKGIVWPLVVAPYEVVVVVAQPKDEDVVVAATRIYEELRGAGHDVILDDRPDRLGVKLSDIELIGIPLRVTVGKRGLHESTVELTTRASGETVTVSINSVVAKIVEAKTSLAAAV